MTNVGARSAHAGLLMRATSMFAGEQGVFAFWKFGVTCYGAQEFEQ